MSDRESHDSLPEDFEFAAMHHNASSIDDIMDGFAKNTKEMLAGLQADPAMLDGIAPSMMSPGNDSIN